MELLKAISFVFDRPVNLLDQLTSSYYFFTACIFGLIFVLRWEECMRIIFCLVLLGWFTPEPQIFGLLFISKFMFPLLLQTAKNRSMRKTNKESFTTCNEIRPKKGDILEFPNTTSQYDWLQPFKPVYSHWGLYAELGGKPNFYHLTNQSDGRFEIMFESLKEFSDRSVRINNLEDFAALKGLERKPDPIKTAKDIMNKMSLEDSQRDYELLKYNCEHFVTECVYGVAFSSQADVPNHNYANKFVSDFFYLWTYYMLTIKFQKPEVFSTALSVATDGFESSLILKGYFSYFLSIMEFGERNPSLFTFLVAATTFLVLMIFHYDTEIGIYFGIGCLLALLVWPPILPLGASSNPILTNISNICPAPVPSSTQLIPNFQYSTGMIGLIQMLPSFLDWASSYLVRISFIVYYICFFFYFLRAPALLPYCFSFLIVLTLVKRVSNGIDILSLIVCALELISCIIVCYAVVTAFLFIRSKIRIMRNNENTD